MRSTTPAAVGPRAATVLVVAGLSVAARVWAADAAPDCAACHEELHRAMAETRHGNREDARTPYGSGKYCEACHGDASAHLKDAASAMPSIRFGPVGDGRLQDAACLSCHTGGGRMHWSGSAHERARVPCASCHNPHAPTDEVLIAETQAGTCFACHKNVRADLFRSSTHPLRTGWMPCSSCHNPHGSLADFELVRSSVNETCYDCHAEKRGPFLWEHPPAREDCTNCHTPHGSNSAPLLKARGPYLCQQCHLSPFHPSTLYSGNNLPPAAGADKMLANNCMNCHSKVHGSNHPSGARFTR